MKTLSERLRNTAQVINERYTAVCYSQLMGYANEIESLQTLIEAKCDCGELIFTHHPELTGSVLVICPKCKTTHHYQSCVGWGTFTIEPKPDWEAACKNESKNASKHQRVSFKLSEEKDYLLDVLEENVDARTWDEVLEHLGMKEKTTCEHGEGLTDYCEPCGRINNV